LYILSILVFNLVPNDLLRYFVSFRSAILSS